MASLENNDHRNVRFALEVFLVAHLDLDLGKFNFRVVGCGLCFKFTAAGSWVFADVSGDIVDNKVAYLELALISVSIIPIFLMP